MYYAHMIGTGQGCDYTIGCNTKLEKLSAENDADALREAEELYNGYSGGESRIESITILKVESQVELDIEAIENRKKIVREEREKKEQQEHDRVEFERLKKQFGG
jgi:hypothetical protein